MSRTIRFRTKVLSHSDKQQIYDFYNKRRHGRKITVPTTTTLGGVFGELHFWRQSMDIKSELKSRFSALFPNRTLYEISIYFRIVRISSKEDNGIRHIDTMEYSDECFGGVVTPAYKDSDNIINTENNGKIVSLFEGITADELRLNRCGFSYKEIEYFYCPF